MTHTLHLLDPEPTPAWAPFAGIRPLSELRVGAALVRESWEAFVGAETTAIFALPHLAGFREPGVPVVTALRPVDGPAVIGVEDMIVVRANGHTLVMPTGHGDRLKELVRGL